MRFAGLSAIVARSALDYAALLPRASLYVDRAGSPGHSLREDPRRSNPATQENGPGQYRPGSHRRPPSS